MNKEQKLIQKLDDTLKELYSIAVLFNRDTDRVWLVMKNKVIDVHEEVINYLEENNE